MAIISESNIVDISRERIKKGLIKTVEQQMNSENVKISIEHGSKKGENFMGEIYRIIYENSNEDEKRMESSLILKIAPTNLVRREKMRSRDLFVREVNMYDEVLSFFDDFQVSKGVIPSENGFNECAKCYFSISEEFSECLFLEDLKRRQFKTIIYRNEPITFEHVSLVMIALGKFHAISFALKDQQPEKFKELSGLSFEQFWGMFDSKAKHYFLNMLKRLTTVLEEENRFDLLEKFNESAGTDILATVHKLVSSVSAAPYAVICHGDLTTNNSMFRYDEHGKAVEVQLIDWQFTRYASPVIDLVLYLFCSTTRELREQHYEDFLRIYHQSFSDLLTRLGSDPEKLFPYGTFLDQIKKFGIYSIFVGALLLPILNADPDTIPDFDDVAEKLNDEKSFFENIFRIPDELKQTYNKKIIDLFDDLDRLGCMDKVIP